MYKRGLPILVVLAAMSFASIAMASEPDGRVSIRYEWIAAAAADDDAAAKPTLRLSLTTYVDLSNARLRATLPPGIGLTVQAAGSARTPWNDEGIELGDLAAGRTIVVDLDVAAPARGGGVVGFVLQAASDGRVVNEGVGVPVGQPGIEPTLRNGALEFPAASAVPAP